MTESHQSPSIGLCENVTRVLIFQAQFSPKCHSPPINNSCECLLNIFFQYGVHLEEQIHTRGLYRGGNSSCAVFSKVQGL